MSGPGIGAGDIVEGLKIGYKAIQALREDDDGARHHYQQAKRSLGYRVRASEDLNTNLADIQLSSAAQDSLNALIDIDNSLQVDLSRFEGELGRGGRKGFCHGIISKLKYGMNSDERVQEDYNRARPAADAVMFQTMKYVTTF